MESLYQPVTGWMVGCGSAVLKTSNAGQTFKKRRFELLTSIGYDIGWAAETGYPTTQQSRDDRYSKNIDVDIDVIIESPTSIFDIYRKLNIDVGYHR